MTHEHTYEPVSHHGITSELMELGIQGAEIRRCTTCKREAVFILTRKGQWFPLFDERREEEQDILMA
ncbi:MAG: hypothetical protein AB1553_15785 [Nitrospirota bacterium]